MITPGLLVYSSDKETIAIFIRIIEEDFCENGTYVWFYAGA